MAIDREGRRPDRMLSGGNRIPNAEVVELASRSSGPGGQHVNTSSTRVSLRWNLRDSSGLRDDARTRLLARLRPKLSRDGVLIVHSDRHRSRQRNLDAAYERLYELVESALYQAPPRKPTTPSRGAKKRRLDAKRRRSDLKSRRRLGSDDGH
jgi:ribosome-associated protein